MKEKGLRWKHLINGKLFTGVHFERKVEWLPGGERALRATYHYNSANENSVGLFNLFDKIFASEEDITDSYIAICDIKNWYVYKIVAYRYTEGEKIMLTCRSVIDSYDGICKIEYEFNP